MLIVRPGLLTTVQDRGRYGYQDRGVPVSGPMDAYSLRAANLLVGNDESAAALEVTLAGPEVEFESATVVGISGARFQLTLDGQALAPDTAAIAPAGSHLVFGPRLEGTRAYLAVAGGIVVPAVLGSRSTDMSSRIGGLSGRPLKSGDRLAVGEAGAQKPAGRGFKPLPLFTGGTRLRVLLGPHVDRFDRRAVELLTSSRFEVSPQSNRMGYRLDGPPIGSTGRDLLSCAMPMGALQVPASGQPVLLMADRATTGGYPVIATVISADLPLAGQLAPGDWVQFSVCTPQEAVAALRHREAGLGGA